MTTKYKTTGCGKFFLFLLVFAPLAYFGARYFTGESGENPLADLFSKQEKTSTTGSTSDSRLKDQVRKLEKDVQFFERENARLESELKACREAKD